MGNFYLYRFASLDNVAPLKWGLLFKERISAREAKSFFYELTQLQRETKMKMLDLLALNLSVKQSVHVSPARGWLNG